MMNMYTDLIVWKESVDLIKMVYKAADKLPKAEEYNLKQQLKRAVASVALNIAEGKNRKTSKDFANFLTTAVASLAETEAILQICIELDYIKSEKELQEKMTLLGRKINALKNKLTKSVR